jgi:hypothetical protein
MWRTAMTRSSRRLASSYPPIRRTRPKKRRSSGSWRTRSAWAEVWGIYWGTLHLIERCMPGIALPIIQDRAIHGQAGSRWWCCFILGRRRDINDLPLFLALLNDDHPEV